VGAACNTLEVGENFFVRPGGKGPLERPRRRWEDDIKSDRREAWRV
jgi:hypothetical protein